MKENTMNCEQCKNELVDYLKDELDSEVRRQVEAHLSGCEECCKEREILEQTFDTLARELVPIELSAHFRMALAERLDAATIESGQDQPDQPHIVRSSERHIRDMKRPAVIKLWDHAKRSPYFAASLVLHAAALLIICAAVVKMQAQSRKIVTIESRQPANTGSACAQPEFTAYLARKDAHRIKTRAVPVSNGMRVDLSQLYFMGKQELVLVGDDDLSCVRGYFVESESGNSRNLLMKQYPDATSGIISNAEVDLPMSLARYISASRELFVFRLKDRLEFWSRPTWNRLRRKFAGRILSHVPRGSGQLRIDGPFTNFGLMTSWIGTPVVIDSRRRRAATL